MAHDEFLLIQLENLTEKLGVTIRHENVHIEESSGTGGLCRIEGEYVGLVGSPRKEANT